MTHRRPSALVALAGGPGLLEKKGAAPHSAHSLGEESGLEPLGLGKSGRHGLWYANLKMPGCGR